MKHRIVSTYRVNALQCNISLAFYQKKKKKKSWSTFNIIYVLLRVYFSILITPIFTNFMMIVSLVPVFLLWRTFTTHYSQMDLEKAKRHDY